MLERVRTHQDLQNSSLPLFALPPPLPCKQENGFHYRGGRKKKRRGERKKNWNDHKEKEWLGPSENRILFFFGKEDGGCGKKRGGTSLFFSLRKGKEPDQTYHFSLVSTCVRHFSDMIHSKYYYVQLYFDFLSHTTPQRGQKRHQFKVTAVWSGKKKYTSFFRRSQVTKSLFFCCCCCTFRIPLFLSSRFLMSFLGGNHSFALSVIPRKTLPQKTFFFGVVGGRRSMHQFGGRAFIFI